jgi:large subunit ribosomal protein L11
MAKKGNIVAKVKLMCMGGAATPAPPVGPALSQHGVNIGDFVKRFNADTSKFKGSVCPVIVTVYQDKSFDLTYKSSPTSDLLRKAAKVEKGSGVPNKNKVGKVTMAQVKEIANLKLKDLNAKDVDGACRIVMGTARSMGIDVQG